VRVIEFVNTRVGGGDKWYEYLNTYWKNAWIHQHIKLTLLEASSQAAQRQDLVDPADRPTLETRCGLLGR